MGQGTTYPMSFAPPIITLESVGATRTGVVCRRSPTSTFQSDTSGGRACAAMHTGARRGCRRGGGSGGGGNNLKPEAAAVEAADDANMMVDGDDVVNE